MMMTRLLAAGAALAAFAATAPAAHAQFAPRKPVEMVVSGNAGGGSDQFARQIQAAVQKHDLNPTNIVVVNKGGGSGAEGFIYGKGYAGDETKLIIGTNNEWILPMVAKVGFTSGELTPVAVMALDEFIVWVQPDAPYKTIMDMVEAAKATPGSVRFGGSQSKDTDQTLVRQIENATGAKFTYVPFKSGAEASTQLAGKHIDANTNNPAEITGQWRAGQVRPLCVMSAQRLADTTKVTDTMAWSDIPTCKEQGLPIDSYQMPRTVFMPGEADPEAVSYYADMLRKVSETPEFKEYVKNSSQTGRFMTGEEMKSFVDTSREQLRAQYEKDGWLVQR
ncbi:tripartite tricarboxylate transporter substrate binding protein [Aureimonas jatrophae]|uniref:Tripartite-type tricarboxylate transporter, receptor component TctC n=1 Tax=Aureimonas jatrophae TaxID=1166073 RepID=A0A1H0LXG6_9HYPH|nr:Tripartite-type tricarboxylate transporter, receptor component TctC [Aureimonas jatrophae]